VWRIYFISIIDTLGVEFIRGLFHEATHIINVDRAIIRARYQELVILCLHDLLNMALLETCHRLKLLKLRAQVTHLHLTGGTWLLEIGPVLLAVFESALDHHELYFINLSSVVICNSFYNLAFL
jgi:hypothetical protein